MVTVLQLKARFEALNAAQAGSEAVSDTSNQLSDKNRQQLTEGYNKKGEKIGDKTPYRNKYYAGFKNRINPVPGFGNPDLKFTGSFHKAILTTVSGEVIHTESSDSKAPFLIKKYKDLFGLGGSFKAGYIQESLRPAFIKKIKEQINL